MKNVLHQHVKIQTPIKMNKFIILISVLVINSGTKKDCNCEIVKGKGINNIVVGKSKIEDVKSIFGDTKKTRIWRKPVESEIFGNFDFTFCYDSIAKFSTYRRVESRKTIALLEIKGNSKCRTNSGFGVGSSYNETLAEFGNPKLKYNTKLASDRTYKLHLFFDKTEIIFNSTDTNYNKVEKIIFSSI